VDLTLARETTMGEEEEKLISRRRKEASKLGRADWKAAESWSAQTAGVHDRIAFAAPVPGANAMIASRSTLHLCQ
jgi:hypothetical protein